MLKYGQTDLEEAEMFELKVDIPILFLDLLEIESSAGVKQCLERARKFDGNPVIRVGKVDAPDALQVGWPFSVVFDEEDRLFKVWYAATGHRQESYWNIAYAYSADGIEWIKPELGVIEYCGSKRNNLVFSADKGVPHAIFIDPAEPDRRKRFKALMTELIGKRGDWDNRATMGKMVLTSPDGIHWTREEGPYVLEALWPPQIAPRPAANGPMHYFDIHQLLYDPYDPNPEFRYKVYGQSSTRVEGAAHPYRNISAATAPRLGSRLTCYDKNPILDIEREQEIHFALVHRIDGHYIMLHEFAYFEPMDDRYTGDVRISVSRDGFEFQRLLPRKPLIARGEVGEWDDGFIVLSSEVIERDDKLWIFYSGASERWNNWPQRTPEGFPLSAGQVHSSEIGVAWLRADGYAYMTCDDAICPGTLTTQPLVIPDGPNLRLAVGTEKTQIRRSWLEVEVLDARTNEPIPGFSQRDAVRCVQDGIRVPVRWNGGQSVSNLAGQTVKLRFYLFGHAKLFSFRVVQ